VGGLCFGRGPPPLGWVGGSGELGGKGGGGGGGVGGVMFMMTVPVLGDPVLASRRCFHPPALSSTACTSRCWPPSHSCLPTRLVGLTQLGAATYCSAGVVSHAPHHPHISRTSFRRRRVLRCSSSVASLAGCVVQQDHPQPVARHGALHGAPLPALALPVANLALQARQLGLEHGMSDSGNIEAAVAVCLRLGLMAAVAAFSCNSIHEYCTGDQPPQRFYYSVGEVAMFERCAASTHHFLRQVHCRVGG